MSSSNERPIFQEKMKLKLSDKTPEPVNFFYEDFDRQLKATHEFWHCDHNFATNTGAYKIDNECS